MALVGDNAETNSEMTEKTGISRPSGGLRATPRGFAPVMEDEDGLSPSPREGESPLPLKKHVLIQLEGQGAVRAMEDEEQEAEDRRLEEEEKKKEAEDPLKKYFRDEKGNMFNPSQKFGMIEPDVLLYDDITSSHPLNLPTDYYHK